MLNRERSAEQEMFHNGNRFEYYKDGFMSNNKNLRSQIFIYCFVALIVEMNQWNLVMWSITDILP
jgi:hypothetical protein